MAVCPKCGAVHGRLSAFVECPKCAPPEKSQMKKHLKYASYVLRHKWYVFVECVKLGIPVRGMLHDLSKFLPSEWFPYVEYFYGRKPSTPWAERKFDFAWLLHQKRNPHHHQYWVLKEDSGAVKVFEMPLSVRKEMLADWKGAGKAQGKPNTLAWYIANRDRMTLGPDTRVWIEQQLGFDQLSTATKAGKAP